MDGSVSSDSAVKRSLVRKLVEVMSSVGGIPKNGHNSHFNYDFVTESDVMDAVRSELAKRCVLIVPSVVESKELPVGEKGQRIFTLRMRFTAMDGESGETFSWEMYGQGADSQDKGAYKATTGAMKYGIMKLILASTGDDPEHERANSTTPPPPAGVAGLKARMKPTPPPAAAQSSVRAGHDRALVYPFGNCKGLPISDPRVDAKSLVFWLERLWKENADASKSKWHARNVQTIATLQAEQRYRSALEAEQSSPPDDGPPPLTDDDAPQF